MEGGVVCLMTIRIFQLSRMILCTSQLAFWKTAFFQCSFLRLVSSFLSFSCYKYRTLQRTVSDYSACISNIIQRNIAGFVLSVPVCRLAGHTCTSALCSASFLVSEYVAICSLSCILGFSLSPLLLSIFVGSGVHTVCAHHRLYVFVVCFVSLIDV